MSSSDGLPSRCLLFFNDADLSMKTTFYFGELENPEAIEVSFASVVAEPFRISAHG